jgi:hypothetical protein
MGRFTGNLYDEIPAKTQTPKSPLPKSPLSRRVPESYGSEPLCRSALHKGRGDVGPLMGGVPRTLGAVILYPCPIRALHSANEYDVHLQAVRKIAGCRPDGTVELLNDLGLGLGLGFGQIREIAR